MGGYGSTRWYWHNKKTAVEDCRRLPMKTIHAFIRRGGWSGTLSWSRGKEPMGNISYRVIRNDDLITMRLIYTITRHDTGEKTDFDYPVRLSTTPLPWGGLRFWFHCPIAGCGRRVSVLYLAPLGKYFACRHCNRLSYRSRQEGSQDKALFGHIAKLMVDEYPHATWRDWKEVFSR